MSELDRFIVTAKKAGVAGEALVALLRHNGWSERRVYAALTAYYAGWLGTAPPGRSGRDHAGTDR